MNSAPKLGIIIPCYNEAEMIQDTVEILSQLVESFIRQELINENSFLLFVDDGSKDKTYTYLKEKRSKYTRIIKLTKNQGHQYALLAGIHYIHNKVDCAISIDADLQDDLSVIEQMIQKFGKGYHIVCGVRENRDTDSFFKKQSARIFYSMMRLFGIKLIRDHADFRLLSNHAIEEMQKYKEYNLFLRGIFPAINLKLTTIRYTQRKRQKGKTKYNLKRMLSLAIQGVTSFSTAPIRLITFVGIVIFLICIGFSVNVLYIYTQEKTVPGWASITLPLYFLGGVQMFSLGIIGEYIAKIYKETKRRPHYHIEEIIE